MKKIYLLIASITIIFLHDASAQLTGTKNIPGDYSTLALAITDLNTQGVGAGGVTLNLLAGNPETAPAGGYVIGGTGSLVLTTASATNPISVIGNANTITASAAQTVGSLTDAIFKLIGADYVTISGFVMLEDAGNTNTVPATNTMTEWGVALLHASLTDGCQYNTIQSNTITLNRTYSNSFGIYGNNRHSQSNVTVAEEVTDFFAGIARNNKFYSNTISNVNFGIVMIGSAGGTMDNANDIGGSSLLTGNNISNWGGAASATAFISLSGSSVCIYANHEIAVNVSYNTLVSAAVNFSGTLLGIYVDYVTTSALGTFTNNITNNRVTLVNSYASVTATQMQVIRHSSAGGANGSATVNMNNNMLINCAITGAGTVSITLFGVLNTAAFGTVNMNSNIIESTSSTATAGGLVGVTCQAAVATAININNNQIGDGAGGAISFSSATSGGVTGISNTVASATCALTINGNNFQGFNYAVASSGGFTCISSSGAVLTETISNNNFNNITINTSASILGFLISATNITPTVIVSGNYITTQYSNITPTGAVNQIAVVCNAAATATGSSTISNNNFSNITFRTTTSFGSIYYWLNGNVAGSTHNISFTNNTILNLTNNGTANTAGLYGVMIGFGNQNVLSGNSVSGLLGTGLVTGIQSNNASLNTNGLWNIFNNKTFNLSSGADNGAATGLASLVGPNQSVYLNKVYDITNTNIGLAVGIAFGNATVTGISTLHNNIIGRIYAPTSNYYQAVRGLSLGSTVANSTSIYYNTIYLDGATLGESYCAYMSSATPTYTFRNNIFINNVTASDVLEQMVYFRPGASLSTYSTASDNNILYAGTPGPLHLIYADGAVSLLTNKKETLTDFQAYVTPREVNSKTELTPFFNTTVGSAINYLHVDPAGGSLAESGAVNIAGITTDFDLDIRQGNPGYPGTGTAPDIGADEFDITIVLPITIEFFRGAKQTSGNLLDWKVSCTSTPYATLTLERSADGRNFSDINSQVATSLRCQSPFSYVDAAPLPGINYYRLKMTDADGKTTYSHLVVIINKEKGFEIVGLNPNPVYNVANLNLSTATSAKIEIIITDINGRLMQKQSAQLQSGSNLVPLKVATLAPGSYQVTVINEDGEKTSIRFVKQ